MGLSGNLGNGYGDTDYSKSWCGNWAGTIFGAMEKLLWGVNPDVTGQVDWGMGRLESAKLEITPRDPMGAFNTQTRTTPVGGLTILKVKKAPQGGRTALKKGGI